MGIHRLRKVRAAYTDLIDDVPENKIPVEMHMIAMFVEIVSLVSLMRPELAAEERILF